MLTLTRNTVPTTTPNPKQLLVPGAIDIPLILTSIGKSTRFIQDHQDKYNYVLHKILETRVFNKTIHADGYSNLHQDTLRAVLGSRYTDTILKDLQGLGIIECDGRKQTGKKSYGYRIHADYAGPAVTRFIFKEAFEAKLQQRQAVYNQARLASPAQEATWRDLTSLGIDEKAALAYIRHKYNLEDAKEIEAYNADKCSILKIANEEYFLEQPDPKSRIYTNVSNLSSDLRQFLTCKKSANYLVNLDIANSQPYLFALLLRSYYQGRELPEDVKHYLELTSTGRFYEFVMDLLQVSGQERKSFKIDFFGKIFYCRSGYSKRTQEGKVFTREFPNVMGVVDHYKEAGHEQLAIAMQRSEANIMLHQIAPVVRQQGIWCATIHDSIVCTAEHAETVRTLMLSAFLKAVGMPPLIKKEELKKQEA
jgi:hypothetical protein